MHHTSVAQLAEHPALTRKRVGSLLTGGINLGVVAKARSLPCKQTDWGRYPAAPPTSDVNAKPSSDAPLKRDLAGASPATSANPVP